MKKEIRFLLGGPQGSGLETAAQVLTSSYAIKGYRVYSTREYYSNIKGRHSYVNVRVSSENLPMAPRQHPDLIAGIDAETIFIHFPEASNNTIILYDKNQENTRIDRIPSIEPKTLKRLKNILEQNGYGQTLKDALLYAEEVRGARLLPLDYRAILKKLSEELGISLHVARRYQNTILIAAIASMTGLSLEALEKGFVRRWPGRTKIIEGNKKLAEIVYSIIEETDYRLGLSEPINPPNEYMVVSGNDIVAIGKIVGGLRIQTYYPITPAADESFTLEEYEDLERYKEGLGGIVVFQTEDEIAAISAAIGAALTGARSATATSGPGFDLMVEALGWAGINEVPVVVTYYQRGGPSTGLPTRGGQQDLYSAVFSGHGEYPRIVIASGDHREAFIDAVEAMNLAERYQLPVIHLLDKFLANSIVTLPVPELENILIDRGLLTRNPPGDYKRFDKSNGPISPRAPVGAEGIVTWHTGDEHNEEGHICEDPMNRLAMHNARMKKLEIASREIPSEYKIKQYGGGRDFLLIGWGSTKGAALETLKELESVGIHGSYLHIRMLEPFPVEEVTSILREYDPDTVIDVEASRVPMLANLVSLNTGFKIHKFILKWTGRPIYVDELVQATQRILDKQTDMEVLKHGA
ncbi:MAG: 2-oxoacid:acceptor oxidoreductase subunit alpha [Desulfurococcales archaeon]|nr:2-oxoacid:acceptor oxidoreductase subunit alpha [Desulfurococcales archaeon]